MAFKNPSASSSSIIAVRDLNTSGVVNYLFTIPSDVDSIMAMIWLDTTWVAAGSAIVYIQTTTDGGSTWKDVSATAIGTATVAAAMAQANAHMISIGCIGSSYRGITNYIGSVQSSTLVAPATTASATGITSGMPMLSTLGRISIQYTSTITTSGINVQIFAPTGELR